MAMISDAQVLGQSIDFITEQYDDKELNDLIGELGVTQFVADDTSGPARVKALVFGLEERGRITDLLDALQRTRPQQFAEAGLAATTPPQPAFLVERNGTRVSVLQTEEPWMLPTQALVLPMGPQAGRGGLVDAYLRRLGSPGERFIKEVQDQIGRGSGSLRPERPYFSRIPDGVRWPALRPRPDDPSPSDRYVVAATAYQDPDERSSVAGAVRATRAVVSQAANHGISYVTLPLVGTGRGGLSSDQVMEDVLNAVLEELAVEASDPRTLLEVTLTTRNPAAYAVAQSLFSRPQHPLSDAVTGEDRLNIAVEAYALADALLLRGLEPPLSVGILGGWGSGKSFVMHLMQRRMAGVRSQRVNPEQTWLRPGDDDDSKLSPVVGHIYQINFSAWDYAKSNLWASLMHTIFYELNRQLTIEKRLAEELLLRAEELQGVQAADVPPMLRGNPIWQAMYEMSEHDLELLLERSRLKDLVKDLKQVRSGEEVSDLLWQELMTAKEDVRTQLYATRAELAAQQAELEDARGQLETYLDQKIARESRAAAWEPVKAQLRALLGSAYETFKKTIDQGTGDQETEDQGIETEAAQNEKTQVAVSLPMQEALTMMARNPVEFGAFGLFIVITVLSPLLISALSSFTLPSWAAAFIALVTASFEILAKWDKTVMDSYELYRQQYDQARARIEGRRDELTEELLARQREKLREHEEWVQRERVRRAQAPPEGEAPAAEEGAAKDVGPQADKLDVEGVPNLPVIEQRIQKLEVNVRRQRELVGLTADHLTLTEFITARLDDAYYEKRLGMMHQVKLDLDDLSEGLRGRDELFPRGPARVVLYIDDLDRCPPKRVVEVLEATQLLLKTDLFVVVLAVDVSYIVRALEKHYEKTLIRRGHPSGLDYIEKIIQIPYQVRPIDEDAIGGYLLSQMQLEEAAPESEELSPEEKETREIVATERRKAETAVSRSPQLGQAAPLQTIDFTPDDYRVWLEFCRNLDMTPRSVKRLINVSKIIKLIWFRRGDQPQRPIVDAVFLLLALSERYPDLMRELLEQIAAQAKTPSPKPTLKSLVADYQPEHSNPFLDREVTSLKSVVDQTALVADDLTPWMLGTATLNLVRSFCFVGNIGYDPGEQPPSPPGGPSSPHQPSLPDGVGGGR